ncbi:SprB repeat-containing protein, partial [Klebsiella pneumoniae]|uniref:SprB repeat-containing protein n=1 Tax=Klebsiella pneumoniae TaxID=573 RepID=UPI0037BF14A5
NGKEDGKIDVTLKGKNGPYTFQWNDGSTEDHLHDIPKVDYYLIIRDRNSCIFEKSINVGVLDDKPRVKIEGGGERTFCSDDENQDVELHAVTSVCAECKLKWSTGSTEEKIKLSGDGDFQVTATDSSGCFQKDSTEVKIKTDDCD